MEKEVTSDNDWNHVHPQIPPPYPLPCLVLPHLKLYSTYWRHGLFWNQFRRSLPRSNQIRNGRTDQRSPQCILWILLVGGIKLQLFSEGCIFSHLLLHGVGGGTTGFVGSGALCHAFGDHRETMSGKYSITWGTLIECCDNQDYFIEWAYKIISSWKANDQQTNLEPFQKVNNQQTNLEQPFEPANRFSVVQRALTLIYIIS